MATAELLPFAATADESDDFTLAAGESCTLFLKDAGGANGLPDSALVTVQVKSSDTEYFDIGVLTRYEPAKALASPGTFRVARPAQAAAVGVDKGA
jgi:hypothetical protein